MRVIVMFDELAGRSIGERLQIVRERTGKSRAVVAGLVGRSEEWLKSIEKGRRALPPIDMLIRLCGAIGVRDLAEIIGDTPGIGLEMGLQRRNGHPVVASIRDAIEAVDLAPVSGPPPDVGELSARTEYAWRLWHTSPNPRADSGPVLAGLIRDGRRAVRALEGRDRREAYAALAGAYALSEQILAWVADSALLWLAADRCMDAAQQADDPETLAAAAWVLGNVWRATGREDDAYRLALDAARLLEPQLSSGPDSSRALWGAVQLHSAITAARLGREGDALHALDEASAMADRMPSGYAHPWTLFGRANSDLTGVSVHVDLRKGSSALDHVTRVDPDEIPSLDRRARLWLESARVYRMRNDWLSTLHLLQKATAVSEESMRCHPLSRGLAGELVTSGGRVIERESRALASRLGLTV
jgi:transcriptional regulator with XRE-family HTH domain